MASAPFRYDTYKDYLGSLLPQWPEYRGLHEYLQEDQPPLAGDTRALIVDCSSDELEFRRLEDVGQFRHALELRPPTTMTRLIFVTYAQTKTLQRSFVDAVGLKFDINPLFMCNHFGAGLENGVRARWESLGISTYAQLSSQKISLELGYLAFLHASVLFVDTATEDEGQQSTVLILLRATPRACGSAVLELDRPSIYNSTGSVRRIGTRGDFLDRYCAMLERWPSQSVAVANQSPMEFLYPLCQLLALEINQHLQSSSVKWKDDEVISLLHVPEAAFRLKGLDYDFRAALYRVSFEMDIRSLKMTIDALRSPSTKHITEVQSALASERWRDLLHDYERLLEEAKQNSDGFEAYETRCMNRFGLMASTKSVQQSESVGRISILAFVFIPLSFITSFFGMNLVEFGTGNIRLSVFIGSATVLVFAMFTVWFLSSWIAGLISDLQENLYGLKIRFSVLRRFAVVSPLHAVLLACFALSHRPREFQTYLLYLGIWGVLGLGKDWDEPEFGSEEQLDMRLSKFWIKRGEEVVRITRKRGWQHSSFYSRWRGRRNQRSLTANAGPSTLGESAPEPRLQATN